VLIPTLSTLLVIIAFIFIYRRHKAEDEELLVLKLIGYYLLGSFRFNFNNLALPAGFFIYAVFFNPQTNKPLKKAIAYLGLVAFFCGILFPFIEKSYFERQRVVNASTDNIYTIDLYKDHYAIKQKLGISEYTRVEDFEVDFENSGNINRLSYMFITNNSNGIVLYKVNYNTDKNRYTIKPTKVNQWVQLDRLISDHQFFYTLNYFDLQKMIPPEEYPYYTLRCRGDYSGWAVKDFDNYLIADSGFKQLNDEELPVKGYVFWICGNKITDEGNYTSSNSENNRAYILADSK
jgi:hypothetical protein